MKIFGLMTVKEHERILADQEMATQDYYLEGDRKLLKQVIEYRTDALKYRAQLASRAKRKRDARKAAKVAK